MRRALRIIGLVVHTAVRVVVLTLASPALLVIYGVRLLGRGWRWVTLQG
jgi:hypothetical protein